MINYNDLAIDGGVVWNIKLFKQLAINNVARMGSEQIFQENYQKQQELYRKIKRDMTKVLTVHNFIYENMSKVNATLRHGKKLAYFWSYVQDINKNGKKLIQLTMNKPQYAVLRFEVFNGLLNECLGLSREVGNVILKEGKDFLIDPYDREILIEKMLDKARMINGYILYLITQLEVANRISYLEQIPILQNWISADKTIVEDIMYKWNMVKL